MVRETLPPSEMLATAGLTPLTRTQSIPAMLCAVVPEPARTRVDIEIHWQRKRGDAASRHLVTAYIR